MRNEVRPLGRNEERWKDATANARTARNSHAKERSGACSGHGGVAEWYQQ
jgi:hypothetical protein